MNSLKREDIKDVHYGPTGDLSECNTLARTLIEKYIYTIKHHVESVLKSPFLTRTNVHYADIKKNGIDYDNGAETADRIEIISYKETPLLMFLHMRNETNFANVYVKVFQDTLEIIWPTTSSSVT